jgi:hypothetical protein
MSSKQNEQRSLLSRVAIGLSLVALFAALTGGAYAATQIGSKSIKANAVKSKQIKDGAVKTAELGNGAVATDKLADASVNGAKLADGAVDAADLKDGSISSADLADGSVTGVKAGAGVLRDMIIVSDREPNTGETVSASKQAFANCPDGYNVVGGGGRILGDGAAADETFVTDLPIVDAGTGLRQWFIQADDTLAGDNDDWALLATAICVKA